MINRDTFLAIKNRRKKVETRAATMRYQNIKAGDKIVFVCGRERFSKIVKKVKKFKTIDVMLKEYKVKDINPKISSKAELIAKYNSFHGYKEKIKKFGLAALELKKWL